MKINRKRPTGFDLLPQGVRCASLDGDADRLVYFYTGIGSEIHLLDGDHISAMFAKFIMEARKELLA